MFSKFTLYMVSEWLIHKRILHIALYKTSVLIWKSYRDWFHSSVSPVLDALRAEYSSALIITTVVTRRLSAGLKGDGSREMC